jgi:hypothetical protein
MPREELPEFAQALGEPPNRNPQIVNRILIRMFGRMPYLDGELSQQPRGLRPGESIHRFPHLGELIRFVFLDRHRRALEIASGRPYAS